MPFDEAVQLRWCFAELREGITITGLLGACSLESLGGGQVLRPEQAKWLLQANSNTLMRQRASGQNTLRWRRA